MRGRTIRSSLVMGCGLAMLVGFGDAASAAEPYGLWVRPSTGTQVRFYDCGGKLCGKIVAVTQEARKKELGIVIMHRAAKTGDNKWEGDLLDAETGKIYSGVATLEGRARSTLKGCVMGILCKGETWTRVK